MTELIDSLPALLAAYLLCSIPFGLLITRIGGHGDIRQIGSGNIGATNVLRTGSKKLALLTLIADMGKGFAALWLAHALAPTDTYYIVLLSPLVAILGHSFPIWLKFKGGKGVATFFGLYLFTSPILFAFAAVGWLTAFGISRISALGALIGLPVALSVFDFFIDTGETASTGLWISLVIMALKHIPNIQRILNGNEHKFSFSSKAGESA